MPTTTATATKEQVGSLLDALFLELLDLIEQQTACRVQIERLSNGGQLLLAKTRYVQGSQTVSVAQIPTENSVDFKALCRVVEQPSSGGGATDKTGAVQLALQRQPIDRERGYVEPLNWFGVLAPTSLRAAAAQFRKCLELVVESANLQRELCAVMTSIERLKVVAQQQQ